MMPFVWRGREGKKRGGGRVEKMGRARLSYFGGTKGLLSSVRNGDAWNEAFFVGWGGKKQEEGGGEGGGGELSVVLR